MEFGIQRHGLLIPEINLAPLFPLSGDIFQLNKRNNNDSERSDRFGNDQQGKIPKPQPQIPSREEDFERRRYNRKQQPTEPRREPKR